MAEWVADHELKTHPSMFALVWSGEKLFEIRTTADRQYAVGQLVRLREWVPETGTYTGRAVWVLLTCVIANEYGLPDGLCVFGFKRAGRTEYVLPGTDEGGCASS